MRGYFLCRFERVFFLLLFINFKKKEEIKEKKNDASVFYAFNSIKIRT